MNLKRRSLIKLACSVCLINVFKPFKVFAQSNSVEITLGSMVETLIPTANFKVIADDLIKAHTLDTNKGKLILWGCRWLNQNSQALFGQYFTSLTEAQKIHILKAAEQSKQTALANQFFTILRADVMTQHYASQLGSHSLAFQTTPQPTGYLNHSLPPIKREAS